MSERERETDRVGDREREREGVGERVRMHWRERAPEREIWFVCEAHNLKLSVFPSRSLSLSLALSRSRPLTAHGSNTPIHLS